MSRDTTRCRRGDLNAPDHVPWCHLSIVTGRWDIRECFK